MYTHVLKPTHKTIHKNVPFIWSDSYQSFCLLLLSFINDSQQIDSVCNKIHMPFKNKKIRQASFRWTLDGPDFTASYFASLIGWVFSDDQGQSRNAFLQGMRRLLNVQKLLQKKSKTKKNKLRLLILVENSQDPPRLQLEEGKPHLGWKHFFHWLWGFGNILGWEQGSLKTEAKCLRTVLVPWTWVHWDFSDRL